MKAHLEHEIENLKNLLSGLASRVESALAEAVRAVERKDAGLALRIIREDVLIDHEEVRIEEECLKALALYQPVAGDLRYVVTLLKVNSELERIGDMAVNIAERAVDLAGHAAEPSPDYGIDFLRMTQVVRLMLKKALDSLIRRNCLDALDVINRDDTVDQLHRGNYSKVREGIESDPSMASYYLNLITVSRNLERIADCATNICEDVIYLEQGRIIRHIHEDDFHSSPLPPSEAAAASFPPPPGAVPSFPAGKTQEPSHEQRNNSGDRGRGFHPGTDRLQSDKKRL